MPNMKTRLEEVNEQLDDIDAWIIERYKEKDHADLILKIAEKVKLEIERHDLISK